MKQLEVFLNHSEKDIYTYIDLLKKWQKAVNLISPSTIKDIWTRHVLDSAQIYLRLPEAAQILVDLGSGAGFPGIILAILNQINKGPIKKIVLIESDIKKSLFLKEVVRQLSLPVEILNQRIETVSKVQADVLTARALAPLNQLLLYGKNFIVPQTTCLFLKGKTADVEIQKNKIPCKIQKIKSITNSESCILKITEVHYD